jgi:hypothetical protein
MPRYKVSWQQYTSCWATVDAESEEEAVAKAKKGEHNDDVDTDPGDNILKTYTCDGLA